MRPRLPVIAALGGALLAFPVSPVGRPVDRLLERYRVRDYICPCKAEPEHLP
jgi:hypothetical protein